MESYQGRIMDASMDPEGREIARFRSAVGLSRYRILDIGCGSGRLSGPYARDATLYVGVDPDPEKLAQAARDHRRVQDPILHFVRAAGERLPLAGEAFDLALMPWSL